MKDRLTILQGDWIGQLRTLPENSIHCCVTSPPYWGLRSYLPSDHPLKSLELGQEKTPEEYVAKVIKGFREVWFLLRDDATLWLNLGDSYNAAGREGQGTRIGRKQGTNRASANAVDLNRTTDPNLKPKDLVGIPWRVAFALQADGWYLRSDIIWHKPNPMPESVTDRPTKSHEYIFLLSKSEKYFYDADAIKEVCASDHFRGPAEHRDKVSTNGNGGLGKWAQQAKQSSGRRVVENVALKRAMGAEHDHSFGTTRNKRSVWTVTTRSYREAHFATFPPDLIKPCILAGCPLGGTVLDPFFGSGTTGQVALELGRKCIGIDLNPQYVDLAHDRTNVTPGLPL